MASMAFDTTGLCEVRLYGNLRAQFGRSHWLAVDSPAEALRALSALFKGFKEALLGHQGPGYRVLVGEGDKVFARNEQDLELGVGRARVIRLAPVIHGRKRQGVLQTVIGVTLMIIAYVTWQPWLFKLGAMIALGGVIQMMSAQKKGDEPPADNANFTGGSNEMNPGGPVPLVIGRFICGSTQASGGVSTDEQAAVANVVPNPPTMPPNEAPNPVSGVYGGLS